MPKNGAYLLSDVVAVGLKQVDVACKKCGRSGRVSVARLIAEHGPGMPLPGLPQLIAKGCPLANANSYYDRCGALFQNLGVEARLRALKGG